MDRYAEVGMLSEDGHAVAAVAELVHEYMNPRAYILFLLFI